MLKEKAKQNKTKPCFLCLCRDLFVCLFPESTADVLKAIMTYAGLVTEPSQY